MTDLGTLSGGISEATSINDHGAVVITNARDINDRGEIAAEGYAVSAPTVGLALLLEPTRPAR
jgi:hypothetical protein